MSELYRLTSEPASTDLCAIVEHEDGDYLLGRLVPVEPPADIPADAKLMWVWSTSDLGDFDWREVNPQARRARLDHPSRFTPPTADSPATCHLNRVHYTMAECSVCGWVNPE